MRASPDLNPAKFAALDRRRRQAPGYLQRKLAGLEWTGRVITKTDLKKTVVAFKNAYYFSSGTVSVPITVPVRI